MKSIQQTRRPTLARSKKNAWMSSSQLDAYLLTRETLRRLRTTAAERPKEGNVYSDVMR